MENLLPELEGRTKEIESIENQTKDGSMPYAKKQELLTNEMKSFQEKILEMSKACLNDINGFINDLDEMTSTVNEMEGSIKIVKNKKGNESIAEGFEPPPCEDAPQFQSAETGENTSEIQLPTGDYVLNFSALDQIGQTVECVANGEEGMPLVREIKPGEKTPTLWSRFEDYFVESKSSRSTFNPELSTFVQTYGIEPSLYPTDPHMQRSVIQSQLDEME